MIKHYEVAVTRDGKKVHMNHFMQELAASALLAGAAFVREADEAVRLLHLAQAPPRERVVDLAAQGGRDANRGHDATPRPARAQNWT